jgi:hypothetical protein
MDKRSNQARSLDGVAGRGQWLFGERRRINMGHQSRAWKIAVAGAACFIRHRAVSLAPYREFLAPAHPGDD